MMVDLRLDSKSVLVVGGGREATRRIAMMAPEGCRITVASPEFSNDILDMARRGRIHILRGRVRDGTILDDIQPDILVAATDDHSLNRSLVYVARESGITSYSASDPDISDYSHVAMMEFGGGAIRMGISTGGKSPLMAKHIRDAARPILAGVISGDILERVARSEGRPGAASGGTACGGAP